MEVHYPHDSPDNKLLIFEIFLSKFSTDYKYAKQVDVHHEHAGKASWPMVLRQYIDLILIYPISISIFRTFVSLE